MKIALIGHSGSGKTSAAEHFATCPAECDMDLKLDPAISWDAGAISNCVLKMPSSVIAVSVHRDALKEIARYKSQGDLRYSSSIHYVYLHVSKETLDKRLRRKKAPESQIRAILHEYQDMHGVFKAIADVTLVSSTLNSQEVAAQIQMMFNNRVPHATHVGAPTGLPGDEKPPHTHAS